MQITKHVSIVAYVLIAFLCAPYMQLKSVRNNYKQASHFTLMINPGGDAQNPGRFIDDNFERSITFSYAQELKYSIESTDPSITVILTRYPGEKIPALQNANFANRLEADLFLSLHFYQETDVKPHMFLYQFCYQPHMPEKPNDFSFYRYDKAYLFNQDRSQEWGRLFYTTCQQKPYANLFTVHDTIKVPCEPLIGITTPAVMVEIGLKTKSDWHTYIEPLAQAIINNVKNR